MDLSINVSMYQCIYIATHLQRVWRCTWRPRCVNSEMHSEIVIERVWRWTCGLRNGASWEIHLVAVIELVWRYALLGDDCANFQAGIEPVWRYTWRPWWREFGDALGACDQARSDENLEAVDGWPAGTQFISWLILNCGNVTWWLHLWSSYGELPGGGRSVGRYAGSWSYIQGSTRNRENEGTTGKLRCMLYLAYAVLSECCTQC